MCEQDDIDYTRTESTVKQQKTPILTNRFPDAGDYHVSEWAEFWGVRVKTINDWVEKFKIPKWGPSNQNYMINAFEFKKAFMENNS